MRITRRIAGELHESWASALLRVLQWCVASVGHQCIIDARREHMNQEEDGVVARVVDNAARHARTLATADYADAQEHIVVNGIREKIQKCCRRTMVGAAQLHH